MSLDVVPTGKVLTITARRHFLQQTENQLVLATVVLQVREWNFPPQKLTMETKSDCVSEISLLVLSKRRRLPLLRSLKERGGGSESGVSACGWLQIKRGPVRGLHRMSQSDGLSAL